MLFKLLFSPGYSMQHAELPWPRIKPAAAAVEVQSLNHWTIRKSPKLQFCILLLYTKAIAFWILVSQLTVLQKSLILNHSPNRSFIRIFYLGNHIIWKYWWFYSFPTPRPLISFSCLTILSRTCGKMLHRSRDSCHHCMVLDFKGNVLKFPHQRK